MSEVFEKYGLDNKSARNPLCVNRALLDAEKRISELEAQLGAQKEIENIRLAGISVISMCNTMQSIEEQTKGIHPDYKHPAIDDVIAAVKREIALIEQIEALQSSKASVDGVYVASRASIPERSKLWRELRDYEGWKINSTWIDEAGEGETDCFEELWTRITKEISISKGVILYAHKDDFPLKGAIVEAGIAIGMGKPVAIVLDNCELQGLTDRPIGSWIRHSNCKLCTSLEEAYKYLSEQKES